MADCIDYEYYSHLAPYISGLVAEKRSLGFDANGLAYQLKRLDRYWIDHGFPDPTLSADRVSDWLCQLTPTESRSSQQGRVGALKHLAVYMVSLGIEVYVPLYTIGNDHNVVHVFSDEEIHELFHEIDTYHPALKAPAFLRLADEYPIIFRLYLCCGMRNNEACSMKKSDADLDRGILTIMNGKNHKDRLIYLPDDLRQLTKEYFSHLKRTLGFEPIWLFPGRNPAQHIEKTSIDQKFNQFWGATEASKHCTKKPTVHCLRHKFVVNKINQWAADGLDINVMLPYLSKYLGHTTPDESLYYYHLVSEAFQTIRQKDTMAAKVIPEVRRR